MKNSILIMTALIAGFFTQAQDVESDQVSSKQFKGANSIEAGYYPFSDFGGVGIKYRHFIKSNTALRVLGSASIDNDQNSYNATDINDNSVILSQKRSSSAATIGLGIEHHLKGTEKLSPYFGSDLSFGGVSYSYSSQDYDYFTGQVWNEKRSESSLMFGLNFFAGFDYYFSKNVFVGTEFGFSATIENYQGQKIETDNPFVENTSTNGGTNFNLENYSTGSLKVGFLF